MEELLYDYHIAKAMGEGLSYNENYKKVLYIEDVFRKYGTNQTQFDSSMVWYTRNTEVLSKVYEKVGKRLRDDLNQVKKLISIRDNKPMESLPGDSVDVWFLERIYRISGFPLNNKLSFNLPSDTNFHARDTLQWMVNYRFIDNEPDSSRAALMAMHIVYENDSIISAIKRILHSGTDTIRLQSDTLGKIKEINGFIYYNALSDSVKPLWIDSISLIRYHSNDSLFLNRPDSLLNNPDSVPDKADLSKKTITSPALEKPTSQPRALEKVEMKVMDKAIQR